MLDIRSGLLLASSLSLLTLQQCGPSHGRPSDPNSKSATSSITWVSDKSGSYPVTDNTKFVYVDNYQIGPRELMGIRLEERIVDVQRTDRECCETHITVAGTPTRGTAWTIKRDGREGEVYGRFYRTTDGGCCGSNIRYVYFDLLTGRQLFSATRPLAEIDVVEACCDLNRYFAVDRLSEPGDDTLVAKLQYGGESHAAQVTYLTIVPNSQDSAVADIEVDFLQAGKLSPLISQERYDAAFPRDFTIFPAGYPNNPPPTASVLNDLSLVLTVDKHQQIKIPIVNDHLALGSAKLPHGFEFRDTPPKDYEGHAMQ